MSLLIERYLICDTADCPGSTAIGSKKFPNGFILRIAAKQAGWHIGPKDLCPECWKKKQKEKAQRELDNEKTM